MAEYAAVLGIDKTDGAAKARPQKVLRDMQADGASPLARADKRHTRGAEKDVEIPDGHRNAPTFAKSAGEAARPLWTLGAEALR